LKKKIIRLAAVAVIAFFLAFFAILYSTNFFKLFEPPLKEGTYYKGTEENVGEVKLTIKNSNIAPTEIVVPKDKIVGVKILNNDEKTHRVVFLRKRDQNAQLLKEYFIKPGEEKLIYGFYTEFAPPGIPENIKEEDFHSVMSDRFVLLFLSARCLPDDECYVSCASCNGLDVQAKVIRG